MAGSLTIGGPSASIRWGYHEAAVLGKWTIVARESGGDLTAVVTSADASKLSQPALTFCVSRQSGTRLKWPVRSLHVADGTLTASLGPQE